MGYWCRVKASKSNDKWDVLRDYCIRAENNYSELRVVLQGKGKMTTYWLIGKRKERLKEFKSKPAGRDDENEMIGVLGHVSKL